MDWDGVIHDVPGEDAVNENDVLTFDGNIPAFISCMCGKRNRIESLYALYEPETGASRLGGKYAEKGLAAAALPGDASMRAAEELGIEVVVEDMNMEWEVALIEWIQSYMGPIARILANVFSFIGGEKGLLILLLGTSFCWKKEVGKKLFLMIPSILAWNAMLKAIVMRPRPYFTYPDRVKAYVNPTTNDAAVNDVAAQGYSFPSMHSSTIPAGYFTLAKASRRKSIWIIAVVFTVLGGISRICAGVHYPTDVLAGWVIGFAVMYIFSLLEKHVSNEWTRHLIILATALPGVLFVRTEEYFTTIGILAGVILAFHYEEARVNYQDTRNGWAMAARMIGAFLIYFGVNTLLKLPFSAEFLSGGSIGALLIRSLRYMIITFLIIGIYPKLFPYFERLGPAHK